MRNLILCVIAVFIGWQTAAATVWANDNPKEDPFTWKWYEGDNEGNLRMNLYVFWRSTCPHCPPALRYAEQLRQRYPWLRVRSYEISQHSGNLELYRRMAQSLKRPAGQVPAFFFCQQMVLSYHSEEDGVRRVEGPLVHCYQYLNEQWQQQRQSTRPEIEEHAAQPLALADENLRDAEPCLVSRIPWRAPTVLAQVLPDQPAGESLQHPQERTESASDLDPALPGATAPQSEETGEFGNGALSLPELELPPPPADQAEIVELPFVGATNARELSLPVLTLVLAGCDAFNPCAFFVLLSLLSLLIHARNRWRILIIGGVFVLFSGLFYFLFMAAWLNVFFLAGNLQWITVLAGVLAVVIAAINIKDYFYFRRGISLSIPEQAKPGLFERMRHLVDSAGMIPMLAGTLALAVAANSYELLCTAGFPMVFTRVLTLNDLPTASYYGYLALYNVIYIVPLAAIVGVFTVTLGRRKLSEMEGRTLKLLSGVMMLLLGLIIMVAPELLQNVVTAIGILVGALTVTAAIVGCDRWMTHRRRPHRATHVARDRRPPVSVGP